MNADGESGPSERPAREQGSSAGSPRPRKGARKIHGLLGVGLDNLDGHRRITQGEDFLLYGGSQETHERMTDIVLRMRERLKTEGKSFGQLSRREFEDLAGGSL